MHLSFYKKAVTAYLAQIVVPGDRRVDETPMQCWLGFSGLAHDISYAAASAHSPSAEPVAYCEYAGSLIGSVA